MYYLAHLSLVLLMHSAAFHCVFDGFNSIKAIERIDDTTLKGDLFVLLILHHSTVLTPETNNKSFTNALDSNGNALVA